jgi:hypothetical protein
MLANSLCLREGKTVPLAIEWNAFVKTLGKTFVRNDSGHLTALTSLAVYPSE